MTESSAYLMTTPGASSEFQWWDSWNPAFGAGNCLSLSTANTVNRAAPFFPTSDRITKAAGCISPFFPLLPSSATAKALGVQCLPCTNITHSCMPRASGNTVSTPPVSGFPLTPPVPRPPRSLPRASWLHAHPSTATACWLEIPVWMLSKRDFGLLSTQIF